MKRTVDQEQLGKVVYEESAWTGKKNITINGVSLVNVGKNAFTYATSDGNKNVNVKGSMLTGVTLDIDGKSYVIIEKTSALEWVIAFIPFFIILVWGNSAALCSIVPVVGGAVGGGISGGMSVLTLCQMKLKDKLSSKLIVSLLCGLLTFAICFVLAELILSAI